MNWKMALSGRLELGFGGIECEFGGGSARLPPLQLKSFTTSLHELLQWD